MRALSNNLLAQLFAQSSDDPFLTLFTLQHTSWPSPVYWVNNTEQIVSNGKTFIPFPVKMVLPADDGETIRKISIEFDNVSRELIDEIRGITDNSITVKIQFVLASNPNFIEVEIDELRIKTVSYNSSTVKCELYLDDFLYTEIPNEKYTPTIFPGLFT